MSRKSVHPTGRESPFSSDEIIVSKTDPKGRITYANDVFVRVSGYSVPELLGQPHSIIRHPDMPRCVFKLLWDTIQAGEEIFAYVLNMARNGDHYWVFAHVSATRDASGTIVGYHSNRRKPSDAQIAAITPIYRDLLREEHRPANRKDGMTNAGAMLASLLRQKGTSYDEFVFSL
ncbi:PAS domain-containing protein [Microvirga massiliensis]|uniref:PAS domain-containing protein n=1 Tax=Microvirga massiliensis TaxID=1033741 RepID=UPI00062B87B4|nr:PAS domain-containing protein [Microvirga massiliensis]